jgi:hypothetical protein
MCTRISILLMFGGGATNDNDGGTRLVHWCGWLTLATKKKLTEQFSLRPLVRKTKGVPSFLLSW